MENKDKQVLIKILAEIDVISSFTENTDFSLFKNDEKTKRAVCMTLINIGELVKTLSEGFKQENNRIPWHAIAGLRDVTAHRYQTLRMEDIWVTVQSDIPSLQTEICNML